MTPRYYRIIEDRVRVKETKVDRFFIPYILLPKPKKKPKPRHLYKAPKYRYKPNRFDILWRVKGGDWQRLQTFKKQKAAKTTLTELQIGWTGTDFEGKIHYRREDMSGRTYFEEGKGFI